MAQPPTLCRHCGAALAVGAVACFRCGKLFDSGGPSETEAGKLPTRLGTMARGALLEERWRVVRPVGSNRVGTVWLGQDVTLDRPVAVLVVHPELGAEPGFPARFEARALKLAAIDERHLAQVLGVGKRDGAQYLVTRHAEGQTLAELQHAQGGRLPAPLATKVLSQLCDALGTLHAWGLAHGALTHANAVIGERDHLTLRDFGEALLAPPAQNSAAADLVALGALGYELLSGHPPAGPLPPRLTGVPDALAECVARCLAPGPPLRPTSAVEVRGWLDRSGVAELLSGGLKIPVAAPSAPPSRPSGASPGSAVTSPSLEVVSDEVSTDPNRARPSEISTDPLQERPRSLELSTQPSPSEALQPPPRLDQLGTTPGVPGPAVPWQTGGESEPAPASRGSTAHTAHLQPVATGDTAVVLPPISSGADRAAGLVAPGETAAMLPPVSSADTAAVLAPVAAPALDLQARIGTETMAPVLPTAETVDLAQPVLPEPSEAERREARRKWILGAVAVALLAPGAFWLISPERDAALPLPPPPPLQKRVPPPRPPDDLPVAAEASADGGAAVPAVAAAPPKTPPAGSSPGPGAAEERPAAAPPPAPPPAEKPSGAKMIVMPSAVELNTDRPADLYKKGKLLGRTPLRTLLPPGANLLTVRPVGDGAAYEWEVEVEPPLKLEFFTSIQALRDEALQESLRGRSAAGQAAAPRAP